MSDIFSASAGLSWEALRAERDANTEKLAKAAEYMRCREARDNPYSAIRNLLGILFDKETVKEIEALWLKI